MACLLALYVNYWCSVHICRLRESTVSVWCASVCEFVVDIEMHVASGLIDAARWQAGRQAKIEYVRTTHRPHTTHHAAHPRRYQQPLEAQHSTAQTHTHSRRQTRKRAEREAGLRGTAPSDTYIQMRPKHTSRSAIDSRHSRHTCVRVDARKHLASLKAASCNQSIARFLCGLSILPEVVLSLLPSLFRCDTLLMPCIPFSPPPLGCPNSPTDEMTPDGPLPFLMRASALMSRMRCILLHAARYTHTQRCVDAPCLSVWMETRTKTLYTYLLSAAFDASAMRTCASMPILPDEVLAGAPVLPMSASGEVIIFFIVWSVG